MEEKLMELLNDYYGDSRSDDHKEEIADFIRGYSYELLEILKHNQWEISITLSPPEAQLLKVLVQNPLGEEHHEEPENKSALRHKIWKSLSDQAVKIA